MARIFQDGFENNDTTTNRNTWDTWSLATISTTHVRTGTYAMRISSLASATPQGAVKKWLGTAANGPYYMRAYLYVVTPPSANNTIMGFTASSTLGGSVRCSIILASDGTLKLFSGNSIGSQIGSASAAVTDSAWHMLELQTDTTAASGSRVIEARLDGSVFATSSAESQSSSLAFTVGGNLGAESQTTGEWWFDDVALNDTTDTSQTSYPGSGKIITLRPNAAGDANGFTTQTGGTAGSTNNYTRVNEFPPDDATSFNGAHNLNTEDLFNMDDSGIGASDTVNVVQVNGRFRNNVADLTTGIKFETEKTSGGTKSQSAGITPDTTSWNTNGTAIPRLPVLTLYTDPDGAAWTQTTLDSMQAGYRIASGSTNDIDVTALWVTVDYTPAAVGGSDSTPRMLTMGAG